MSRLLLDTHVWVWWVDGGSQLPPDYLALLQAEAANGLGVCAISCWEVAKLVELGRLQLNPVPGMPTEHAPFGFTTSAKSFGYGLFTKYMLPIQVAGFLLLLAMVGVVVISKKYDGDVKEEGKENSK